MGLLRLFFVPPPPLIIQVNHGTRVELPVVNPRLALRDHYVPNEYNAPTCIQLPPFRAHHYEIKPQTIQMLPNYHGLPSEEPYKHLDEFLEMCSTVKYMDMPEEVLRLKLFPFTLKDKEKYWFNNLRPFLITSWAEMQQQFLKKYYPMSKTNSMRTSILEFS